MSWSRVAVIVFIVVLIGSLVAYAAGNLSQRGAATYLVVGLPVIGLVAAVATAVYFGTRSDRPKGR